MNLNAVILALLLAPLTLLCIEQPVKAETPLNEKVSLSLPDAHSAAAMPLQGSQGEARKEDDGTPKITAEKPLEWPEQYTYVGALSSDDLGVELELYWTQAQEYVDAEGCASMSCNASLPGDLAGHVVISDHNYQSGKLFAQAEEGDTVTIVTDDGTFIYEYVGRELASVVQQAVYFPPEELEKRYLCNNGELESDILMDSGWYLLSSTWGETGTDDGRLFFYTCYPLNAAQTNRRLVLEFRLVEGVSLIEKGD